MLIIILLDQLKVHNLIIESKLKEIQKDLWNPSYYVETIGSVSEENIKRYIKNQEKGGK